MEKDNFFQQVGEKGEVQDRVVVFKLIGIKVVLFFSKGFTKEVLNSERKVVDCRKLFIKYINNAIGTGSRSHDFGWQVFRISKIFSSDTGFKSTRGVLM